MHYKQASIFSPSGKDNTRWDKVAVCMSMYEEDTRKPMVGVTSPLEFWVYTNPPPDIIWTGYTRTGTAPTGWTPKY